MLDTSALSPDVKRLFAQVAKQAEQYKKSFDKIDTLSKQFLVDREEMMTELGETRENIASSIQRLEKYAMDTVDEFKEKVEITHRLYKELDKIDRLKSDLFDIREELKTQSLDVAKTITEFNMKAESAVERAIAQAKSTFDNSINKEIERIEGRVSRNLAKFENTQKLHERKLIAVDRSIKAEVKKLAGEIDYVYNSITEIKSDLANYFKSIIDKIQYFDEEVPRISNLLDNSIEKYNHKIDALGKGESISTSDRIVSKTAYDQEEMETEESPMFATPTSVGVIEGEMDADLFTFGDDNKKSKNKAIANKRRPKTTEEKVEDIQEELDDLDQKVMGASGRNIASFVMSMISLAGVLLVVLSQVLNLF